MLEKLSHWIQILSGLVLIVGVILVIAQMRQTERLTRAQITAEWFNNRASQAGTAAGEHPMQSLAKLCDPDATLQLEDALILHSLFLQRFFMGQHALATAAMMEEADRQLASALFQSQLALPISFPQGRAWLEAFPLDEELRQIVEASPYFAGDCSFEQGPIANLLRSDREVKAELLARPPAPARD